MDFGLNCRHLVRDGYSPADERCQKAIERYGKAEWAHLSYETAVPVKVAAKLLVIEWHELATRAKAGEFKFSFREGVKRRMKIGAEWIIIGKAAKQLGLSIEEAERKADSGELESKYLDEHIMIILIARWKYEKCPLVETGGVCYDFQAHDGKQIFCIAEAPIENRGREYELCSD